MMFTNGSSMNNKKSILITGASTGIGRDCALYLDSQGFKIYAGVRNKAHYEELLHSGSGNIQPVMLDICEQEDIDQAFRIISEDTKHRFYGLVNNAGVGISGLIEPTPIEEMIKLFDVNLFGQHRITRIMLPLIRRNRGRIVNMGSSSSFMTGPALGPYSASKFALRAYNDALRIEMKPFGVHVSFVAPGPVESAIWEKARIYKEEVRRNMDPEILVTYEFFVKAGDKLLEGVMPIPAIHVSRAVSHALTAKHPRKVYLIGKNARLARLFSRLPKKLTDYLFLSRIRKAGMS